MRTYLLTATKTIVTVSIGLLMVPNSTLRAQPGTVLSHQKISDTEGGFTGTLEDLDQWGFSVAAVGDLDGDGTEDIAVGAVQDEDGGPFRGAVWILFLNANGTVKSHQKISDTEGGFTGTLDDFDFFGGSVAGVGDLDGDGTQDIAVGAVGDDDGPLFNVGAVWVLFLNTNGTVKSHQKISATAGGFTGTLDGGDLFGTSVAGLGDLDGDGIQDIAVGAQSDDDGGLPPDANRGAVWVLFLNTNGTVKSHQKISDTEGGFTGTLEDLDHFGGSVAAVGDLDGDGTQDIVVGAFGDDDGVDDSGAVWVLFLNTNGTVDSHQKISNTEGGFTGTLDQLEVFGISVAGVGDLDGDGTQDIVVGADGDNDGGSKRGAVWVLFLNADGTVDSHQKISDTEGGFTGTLDNIDFFGHSVAGLGDLDGDGTQDTAVGAHLDDDGGDGRGAVWVLFLSDMVVPTEPAPADTPGTHVLEAAYPNPFNPEATFRFAAYEQQSVRADLVDVLGRVVAMLFEGDVAAGVMQTVRIDGAGLPSGTYAIRLTGETFSDALTLTLLK
ncbi:MAG: FG-GAP repeat protein [Bacteroidetes bacterium]|nr:FG-GAP repeat protein [Bacteroidota bacterium]